MYSVLEELYTELGSLETFVSSISPVNDVLATHPDISIRQYLTLRRQYDYAAFVVALYASFERYTETLVAEYARLISSFTRYSELPEALTKKHLLQSAEMLHRKRLGEGRYANLTSMKVAESLFHCLSDNQQYSLTTEAIISHDTNLRFHDVGKLLSDVGIPEFCHSLHNFRPIWEWYRKTELADEEDLDSIQRDAETDRIIKTIFETRLNDLVERRNEVAHRGGNADELMGQAEMLSRLSLIKALAEAMFETASSSYLRLRSTDESYAYKANFTEGPYSSGSVIVISPPPLPLYIGKSLFSINPDGRVQWGEIVGLMIDGQSMSAIDPTTNQSAVGIKVNLRCNKNSIVWINYKIDAAVWPPTEQPYDRAIAYDEHQPELATFLPGQL